MNVVVLNREQVKASLDMREVLRAVERAYRMKAAGQTGVWPLVSHEFQRYGAVMDIRSGFVGGDVGLHGLKMLNNFPRNAEKGLPAFNGMLMLFDSATGLPLGVMDASYITCMRTGAAGALGAKALARPESRALTVLGAGRQSAFQVAAALIEMPGIERVYVADPIDVDNARRAADALPERLEAEFGIRDRGYVRFAAAGGLAKAVGESDVVITVTPARSPVIKKEWVRPGTHFSCIGADMEGKQEIDPEIFRTARVFADDLDQCARVGEMELPIKNGVISKANVAGELGQALAGMLPGRTDEAQTTIFDATGLALLDLVTAKLAVEGAARKKLGLYAEF